MLNVYYFINQYGWPDGAATAQLLCDVLRASSVRQKVILIQSKSQYAPAAEDATVPQVEIRRLWAPAVGREQAFPKLIGFIAFYVQALWAVCVRPYGSYVVVMTTPPFLNVLGAISTSFRGGQVIAWEMDVYPELLFTTGVVRELSWVGQVLRRVAGWARKRTRLFVVLGPCMEQLLSRGGVRPDRCAELHNWADGALLYPLSGAGQRTSLSLLYSGNLGMAHDVATLAGAVSLLDCSSIEFIFAGGGVGMASMRRLEGKRVRFQGPCSRDALNEVLNAADIGLVTQTKESLGCVVPSKFYGILAAGRGVLYVGPEESTVAQVIRETGCGWIVELGDSEGMARLIRELEADRTRVREVGERARQVFEERFTREKGVARFWELLASLDDKRPT